jgi:hypothetical protein
MHPEGSDPRFSSHWYQATGYRHEFAFPSDIPDSIDLRPVEGCCNAGIASFGPAHADHEERYSSTEEMMRSWSASARS